MLKITHKIVLALIVAGFSSGAYAQDNIPAPIEPPQMFDLEAISFLVGHWRSGEGEYAAEEIWLPPAAGVMPGFFRWPFENGTHVIEALTFVEDEDGLTFYFKHFDPTITPWEKDEANTYRVNTIADNCLYMNRVSDNERVPVGIRYCRLDEETLEFTGIGESETYTNSDFKLTFVKVAE